tara:strand:- start:142 stop:603 length:462 start_codon:yes stop_codon:yes gene_type:complete
MSIFGKKKEKKADFDSEIPLFNKNLPEKPFLKSPETPKMSGFEHDFGTIKKEIGEPKQDIPKLDIPKRNKRMVLSVNGATPIGDQPIFVKIENYKESMEGIDKIKSLCKEADNLLDEIHKIRTEEDRELEKWHKDLNQVKEKLLTVDKKLFEL